MEASACIKAVVFATTQYYNNRTESTLVHLQRQLDVMIGVTEQRSNTKFFLPHQLAATECMTCLVDVLSDPSTVSQLSVKCIQLLDNLVHEPQIRISLYKDFNLSAALMSLIINNCNKASDNLVLDCVQLLQKITYGQCISFSDNYIEQLITYLVKQVLLPESRFTLPCLGLLANLCRDCDKIQVFVNNMENSRQLKLTLIPFLSHNNLNMIIFSLSILTNLCFQEELGDKLFVANNINQTFKMMFNIVINGESGTSRLYAVDLFVDMMKITKIQKLLAEFTHLSASLKKVFLLLASCSATTATKVFELFISFCSVKSIRRLLCHYLIDLSRHNDPVAPKNVTNHHLGAVVNWISASLPSEFEASCRALNLCIVVLEELNQNGWLKDQDESVTPLLVVLSKSLTSPPPLSQPAAMKTLCQKQILIIKTLHNICQETKFVEKMLTHLQVDQFRQLLQFQFNNANLSVNRNRKEAKSQDWGNLSVSLVLCVLNFLSSLDVPAIKSFFAEVMQDSDVVQFLSMGFLSSDREEVHTAIHLLSIGSRLDSFPHLALGDALAANNIVREQDRKVMDSSAVMHQNYNNNSYSSLSFNHTVHIPPTVPAKYTSADEQNIDELIEKMQTNLKDMKLSDMIDVYEHKFQSMQMREQQLQDLLEAKTLAVSRADRVISQYRSRHAEAEAENCSVRIMVRNFEKRTEEFQEKLRNMTVLETDYNNLLAEKQKLVVIAEEHKVLKGNYAEQSQKLENAEDMLSTLRQEHTSLTEMHEILRKQHESLKQQNEVGLEKQSKLSRQLKESETLIKSLQKMVSEIEEQIQKLSRERDNLDEAIEKVRKDLAKTESEKKELQQKISSLELVCQKHESVIKGKTEELEEVKDKLGKHEEIAAMLRNLSSSSSSSNVSKRCF
ncbi:protein CIP2A-like [Argonauta hians]